MNNPVGTPTPPVPDPSDDELQDTPMQDASQGEEDEDAVGDEENEDQDTPPADSDADSHQSTPATGRPSSTRRKRGGRWSRRGGRRDTQDNESSKDAGSDAATPRRRGGWRGRGFGGGRWAKAKGGPSHITQVPLDKFGNMADVKNDEVELPEDPEGELKVDKNGFLQGGRQYRVRTFPIEGKEDRLYMLSTEPARCIGFRDSYLFFQKHPLLFKIILAEEAKKDLIEREIIPHSYKGRAIGVVTARSVFREFGAKIIIGGKKVTDDYYVAAARANGDVEGEYAVPEDSAAAAGDEYDRNRFVAWHGASAVYHTGAPSVPTVNGKVGEKKRRFIVTGTNWMLEHAREARFVSLTFPPIYCTSCSSSGFSRFNSSLSAARRQNLDGVYDVHTNVMQYPKIMQPTHVRWEPMSQTTARSTPPQQISNGQANNHGVNGVAGPDHEDGGSGPDTIFAPVPPVYDRSFMITDIYYEQPATSSFGYPGPDGAVLDVGPSGLTDIPAHILAELPENCREAFYEAQADERRWKSSWGTENEDHARGALRITYNA